MAHKQKGHVVQMLSPENYIRKKARALPLFECLANNDWKETGLANIMVARKHSNGNITMGLYLVDLKCLGVKDANYWFNIPGSEYRNILERVNDTMEMEPVSYTLAHNIVFAGIEFADKFGFKPHNDFTSVAQYVLEEDDEKIELMEIECGSEGKPTYIRGPYDSNARSAQILAQLERTAGRGNFSFIDNGSLDSDNYEIEDDD